MRNEPHHGFMLTTSRTSDTLIEACRLVVILGCTIVFALSATTFADLLRAL